MKLSVLMSTFNRELYIKASIESILNQTYKDFQFIIYDDGSEDSTVVIIKNYQKKDKRIRLIIGDKNRGVGYARNQLLQVCNTPLAIWQDSDDISDKNRIELQVKKSDGKSLVFTNWKWLHWHLGQWKKRDKGNNNQAFASLLFPVDKEILFDENKILGGEDWEFIRRMQEKYNTNEISKVLYYVRFHEDRIGSWKKKLRKDLGGIFTKEQLNDLSYSEAIEKWKNIKDR